MKVTDTFLQKKYHSLERGSSPFENRSYSVWIALNADKMIQKEINLQMGFCIWDSIFYDLCCHLCGELGRSWLANETRAFIVLPTIAIFGELAFTAQILMFSQYSLKVSTIHHHHQVIVSFFYASPCVLESWRQTSFVTQMLLVCTVFNVF